MTKKANKNGINWEKVLVYGITLGWMASTIYLLLIIAATLTA